MNGCLLDSPDGRKQLKMKWCLLECREDSNIDMLDWLNSGVFLQLAIAKDPDAAFFKKLEGLQPVEMSELKAGPHYFAVYGTDVSLSVSFLGIWLARKLISSGI